MSISNTVLKAQIESSHSNEKVEWTIIKELAQSKKLLWEVKRSWNMELYNRMLIEHNELKEAIRKSLEWDKAFSKKERKKIMLEFTNTIYLSKEKWDISRVNKAISYLSYWFNAATSLFSWEEESEWYSTKDIVNLSKTELNLLQENLIKEYLWTDKNYNDEYIVWFNNHKWNYLEKISTFEKEIQNKDLLKIDSIALASYLEYLSSKWNLNVNTLKKYFWENKLKELGELWKQNKWETITQKLLKDAWIEDIIENIISFSDIIKNPITTIPKLKKLPTKEEIRKTPLNDIIEFNRSFKWACPVFDEESANSSMEKFNIILERSKTIELEEYWKENFKNKFNEIINEKIKEKKLSKDQIDRLKIKAEKQADYIFNEWLRLLENPDQACWFELAIFIKNKTNEFLKENNLWELSEEYRQEMTLIIAETNESKIKKSLSSIKNRIQELEVLQNKTPKQEQELLKLKKELLTYKEKIIKAEQIIKSSQATDKELERYIYLINNWVSKKEAYKDFKENNTANNIDLKQNSYYETKTYKYPNWTELVYIETPDWYNIDNWTEWNEWIDITKEEFESIKNRPENLKNLLKFKETLTELNIDFIWEHRFDFIQKLNNIDPTLNIKIDSQNYINNTELKKILNWIIVLSWNKKPNNNLNSIKKSLRDISNSWIDAGKKDNKWSPIEKLFINKWIINKDSSTSYFKIDKMKENYK